MKKDFFELPENYSLAWSADFSKPLDEDFWYIPNVERKGGYWSSKQAILDNNQLIIRTEYRDENPATRGYHSAVLCWKTLRATYGYYEIRCKVDNIRGAWSAFWLMPDDITQKEKKAQDGAEIDIFESALPYQLQTTIHYDNYTGHTTHSERVKDYYDGFHTYAVDWQHDGLKFYYDGKLVWNVTNPDHISHHPVRLEISTELNGFHGKPNRFFWLGNGKITSWRNRGKLPYDYVVDYVRVYDNGELKWSEGEIQ